MKKFTLEKISFNKFVSKYSPILNYKDESWGNATVLDINKKAIPYLFDKNLNKEYITNKRDSYIWSVVLDRETETILLIPGSKKESDYVIITTVSKRNENEYINLTKR